MVKLVVMILQCAQISLQLLRLANIFLELPFLFLIHQLSWLDQGFECFLDLNSHLFVLGQLELLGSVLHLSPDVVLYVFFSELTELELDQWVCQPLLNVGHFVAVVDLEEGVIIFLLHHVRI